VQHNPLSTLDGEPPKTLQASREKIRKLEQLVCARPTNLAREPAAPPQRSDLPAAAYLELAELPPNKLRAALADMTSGQLKAALSKETGRPRRHYNPRLCSELYFALKERRA
jgi:hypothetical protein